MVGLFGKRTVHTWTVPHSDISRNPAGLGLQLGVGLVGLGLGLVLGLGLELGLGLWFGLREMTRRRNVYGRMSDTRQF